MTLYLHEMKINLKSFLIWLFCVAGICLGCILLYSSLEESIQDIAASFSDMGAMSTALGMDKMSLATLEGYYATEIAIIHGLGSAGFAAMLGICLLSKEEGGHTSEFLNTLPVGRCSIAIQKYLAMISYILLFNLICFCCYLIGFWFMGEEVNGKAMGLYHFLSVIAQFEIGTICFFLSSFSKKILSGAGIGLAILFFAIDMMCRILPAISKLKYITPFYYSNAADIFTNNHINWTLTNIGIFTTIIFLIMALTIYCKKDLAP